MIRIETFPTFSFLIQNTDKSHKPPDSTSRPKTIKNIFCNCELQYDFAHFSPTYNDIRVIINSQIINKTEIK